MVAAAFGAAVSWSCAHAASLEAFGQLPAMDDVVISPDGSKIAFVTPVKGQQMVVVESLNPPKFLTGLNGTAQKVRDLTWADSNHLLVAKSVAGLAYGVESEKGEWRMEQVFDVASKRSTALLREYGAHTTMTHIKDNGEMMNVVISAPEVRTVNGRAKVLLEGVSFVDGHGAPALFDVDVETGADKLIDKSVGENNWTWVADAQGAPAAEYGYNQKRKYWSVRIKQGGTWREAYGEQASIESPSVWGISPDGGALIIRFLHGGRFIFKPMSLKDGSFGAPIEAYQAFSNVLTDPVTHRIIGGVRVGLDVDYIFFEKKDQDAWDQILAMFPGEEVELASWSNDRSKMVIQVVGATHGDAYILFDLATRNALGLGDAYPAIKPADIAAVDSIEYTAADGRKIPAFLTLPNGREAKNLPLVVLPHGGPQAMDEPGFDWWAQALASRGYAVLQPQFRGSYGLGWELYTAGFGEWGRLMQTDLSDGVRALARDGMVDPKKVCIVGASYGGYAALAGATLDPGVYRCAVSVSGLSDLRKMFGGVNAVPDLASGLRYEDRYMGVKSPNDPALDQISPAKHVDKVSIPILLIHGKDDTVVPIEQSRIMADALKGAGKPVEFITLPSEDHWLSRSETRLQMLQATVKFLETNNPPG